MLYEDAVFFPPQPAFHAAAHWDVWRHTGEIILCLLYKVVAGSDLYQPSGPFATKNKGMGRMTFKGMKNCWKNALNAFLRSFYRRQSTALNTPDEIPFQKKKTRNLMPSCFSANISAYSPTKKIRFCHKFFFCATYSVARMNLRRAQSRGVETAFLSP